MICFVCGDSVGNYFPHHTVRVTWESLDFVVVTTVYVKERCPFIHKLT